MPVLARQDARIEWLVPTVEAVTSIICSAAPVEHKVRSACAALVDHAMACGAWLLMSGGDEGQRLAVLASEAGDDDLADRLRNPKARDLFSDSMARLSESAMSSSLPTITRGIDFAGMRRDVACAPLLVRGQPVGVLSCLFDDEHTRSDDELQAIQIVARILAVALSPSGGADAGAAATVAARLGALATALPGATLVANRRGVITEVTQGTLAVPLKRLSGYRWGYDYSSQDFENTHRESMDEALAGRGAHCHIRVSDGVTLEGERIIEQTLRPVRTGSGEVLEVVGFARDVTDELSLMEIVRELREKDVLTDCLTMGALRQRAHAELVHAQASGAKIAFFSIDIDRSGAGVHIFGHDAFEELQQTIARRIRTQLPKIHMLARRSEYSFVAVATLGSGRHSVINWCEDIISALKEPVITGRQEQYLRASIGVSLFPDDGAGAEDLLKYADVAAAHAQRAGRNRAYAFNREMLGEITERARLEARLHRAVEDEEFSLVYQPKIDLTTGYVSGAEALLRWNASNGIGPARFIPIAEECGLISYIGEWALREACRMARSWLDAGMRVPVSVNVSTRQFHDHDFHTIVREILQDSNCEPGLIELEVTEGVMFSDPSAAILSFSVLKEMGISLSIDDFGMGYSSLSYLKTLPVDSVKIDRAFINGLPDDADNAAITKAIVAMSKAMGMKVVAEGVEELQCLHYLQSLDCDHVQGYFFSQPLKESDFVNWYRAYMAATAAIR